MAGPKTDWGKELVERIDRIDLRLVEIDKGLDAVRGDVRWIKAIGGTIIGLLVTATLAGVTGYVSMRGELSGVSASLHALEGRFDRIEAKLDRPITPRADARADPNQQDAVLVPVNVADFVVVPDMIETTPENRTTPRERQLIFFGKDQRYEGLKVGGHRGAIVLMDRGDLANSDVDFLKNGYAIYLGENKFAVDLQSSLINAELTERTLSLAHRKAKIHFLFKFAK